MTNFQLKALSVYTMSIGWLSFAYAQNSLYIPLEFQQAYQQQTRSYDGRPGPRYWRNFTRYDMEVTITPGTWEVMGQWRATYINHSSDSLKNIVIRTYAYLGKQEFNRDFADFRVQIILPASYKVWATGELQNPEAVLTETTLEKWQEAQHTDKVVVVDPGDADISRESGSQTWEYVATHIQDFAMGISNRFRWEATSTAVGNRRVLSQLVYNAQDSLLHRELLRKQTELIRFFSDSLPGVVYPYPQFTTFLGVPEFDGMEFPMMANNGTMYEQNPYIDENVRVTAHELAHTYFPFYVGINEVKYSWMEEGLAKFLELACLATFRKSDEFNYLIYFANRFSGMAGQQWEVPLLAPSNHLVHGHMHNHLSYVKATVMYYTLTDVLGKALFRECLTTYIRRWAGKHPTPYDFMFTFEDVSQRDLSWFWKPWILEYGYPELAVRQAENDRVVVEKIGALPVSFSVRVRYANKEDTLHRSAAVWATGDSTVVLPIDQNDSLRSVELLPDTPDVTQDNNQVMF